MFGAQRNSKFGAWRLQGYPQVIEYSQAVIEQIIADVTAGFRKFPMGGIAVGGVFFGQGGRHLVRILAVRPMPCEHSAGPSFTLSENDHAALDTVLASAADDPELEGLEPVGWFHSHTRSGLTMTPADLSVHQRHFPEPWQLSLIVRPVEDAPVSAGIFVRQQNGSLPSQPIFFVEDLNSAVADSSGGSRRLSSPPSPEPDAETAPAKPPAGEKEEQLALPLNSPRDQDAAGDEAPLFSSFSGPSEPRSRRIAGRWIGVVAAVAAALGSLWAAYVFLAPPEYWEAAKYYQESAVKYLTSAGKFWRTAAVAAVNMDMNLRAIGSGGQILVRWDPSSRALLGATSAVLTIDSGGNIESVPLDLNALMLGSHSHLRLSGDLRITLTVHRENAGPVAESTRFCGGLGISGTDESGTVETVDTVRAEIERLRTAILRSGDQNAAFEETLVVLRELRQASERSAVPSSSAASVHAPTDSTPASPPTPPPAPVLEERPPSLSLPPAAGRGAASGEPAYQGPDSGRIIWTGFVPAGEILVLGAPGASTGTMYGRWPGVPIRVTVSPAELTGEGLIVFSGDSSFGASEAIEAPGPDNYWNRTVFRHAPDRAAGVAVLQLPGEATGWSRLSVRANDRPLTALVINWSQ